MACALMACGGSQKQNPDSAETMASEVVAETPKTNAKPVLDTYVIALPDEFLAGDEWEDLKNEMLKNLHVMIKEKPNSHFCSASVGNDEGCSSEATLAVFQKKDGNNYFCVAMCGGGCDCWVPSFYKTYNLNINTGELTEEKPVIADIDIDEFGPLSDATKELMAKALADNTLDHTYYVDYDFETGEISEQRVEVFYNFDIQEQMTEDDWNNFVVASIPHHFKLKLII